LRDYDPAVSFAAAGAAADIGDEAAIDAMIEAVSYPWNNAYGAIERLADMHVTRAGDAMVDRLVEVELVDKGRDNHRRDRVEGLRRAIVDIGYYDRIDEIRDAMEGQQDPKLVADLEQLVAQMALMAANKNKSKRWLEMLASSDAGERELAYGYFTRNGDVKAAEPLTQAFGRVEPTEGVLILRALGGIDAPASRELIERVLTAPEFDAHERAALRREAAWSARRLGMVEALDAAVERRSGEDYLPLMYAAVLGGREILDAYRVPRLDFIGPNRGIELSKIDEMRSDLAHGRSIDRFDQPPARMRL